MNFKGKNIVIKTIGLFFLSVLYLASAPAADAATRTWDGGGADNNWSTAANWSGDVAPVSADDVVFDGTSTKNATVNQSVTVKSVSVSSGYTGTITQSAALTVTGAFTQSAGAFQGTAANASFGTLTLNAPAVFNAPSGNLTLTSGYVVFAFNGGTFNANGGTVVVATDAGYPASYFSGQQRNFYNLRISGRLGNWDNSVNRVANDFTLDADTELGVDIHADGNVFLQPAQPGAARGGTIIFDDAATRTVTISASTIDVAVKINNPNITITTGGAAGATINWTKKITLQAGTLQQPAADYLFNVYAGYNSPGFEVTGGTFQGSAGAVIFNTTIGLSSGNLNAGSGAFGTNAAICPAYPASNYYFQQSGGTFTGGAGNVKFCDARTTGGTFTAPSGNLTILNYADFSAVTFNHNNGTLIIENSVNVVAANKTFYNVKLQGANDHNLSGTPMPTVVGTLDLAEGTMNDGTQLAVDGGINYGANFRGGGKQLVFRDAATRTVNLPASIYLLPMLLDNPNITVTTSGASQSAIYAGNTEVKRGTFQQGAAELFIGPDNIGGAYDFRVSGGTFVGSSAPFTVRAGGGLVLTAGAFQGGTGKFTGNYINTQGGTFSSGGDIEIINYYQSGGTFNAPTGTMTVVADWTHTAGGAFNAGTGSVKLTGYNVYNCANSYSSNVDVTETFYNLEIANSFCNARYIANGDTLIVNNNLRLSYARIGGGRIRPLGTVTIDATNTNDYAGSTVVEYVTPNSAFVINNPSSTVAMLPVEMNAANSTLTSNGAGKTNFYGMNLINGTLNQPNAIWDFASSAGYAQTGGIFNGSAAQLNIANGANNNYIALSGGTFNGGTGLINGGWAQSGGTFSTQGDMNVGQFTLSGGTFNAPPGILDVYNGFRHTAGGTFNPGTGTVQTSTIAGVYNVFFDLAVNETFNNLKFNGTYNDGNHIINNGNAVVNGTLTFNSRGVNGSSITANGDVVHTSYGAYRGGTTLVKFEDAATRTVTLCGSGANDCPNGFSNYFQPLLINNPNITVNAGLTVDKNVIAQAITLQQGTFDQGTGRMGIVSYNQSGGTYNAGTYAGALNIPTTGITDFTLSGGDFNAGSYTQFEGNYTHTAGGNFNYGEGTVTFSGFGQAYNATIDVNETENFNTVNFNVPNSLYNRTIATGDKIVANGNLTITGGGYVGGGTLEAKRDFTISGGFLGGNSNVIFSGAVNQTYTNAGYNSPSGTWTVNKPNSEPLPENSFAPAAPTTLLLDGNISNPLLGNIPFSPLSIVSGNVVQTRSTNHSLASLTLAAGTSLVNEFGGTLTLAGDVTNDGVIRFDANGAGCQTDSILIRSNSATQRNWNGAGIFEMRDVDVSGQAGTSLIRVYSGTDSGNNGSNWIFDAACFAPTAASATVSGKVVNAKGGGIANVRVVLTDSKGISRVFLTNPFGYYEFDEVSVGETVIVSVSSKKFTFENPTRVLNITSDFSGTDFIANGRRSSQ